MARKFSQFTDGLTNQSPTDTLVGLDVSLSANARNSYWTLNSLFSVITRNITDGALRFQGFAAPSVSAAGAGSLYFDSSSSTFKVSQNGGSITMRGANAGDECRIAVDSSWPAGIQIWARVTAANTINCWVHNPTSGSLTMPDFNHEIYIFLKRY